MTTHIYYAPRSLDHDMGPGHPERPERIEAILAQLARMPLAGLQWREPEPATEGALMANHSAEHIELIRRLSGASRPIALTPDTVVSRATFDAAQLASGAALGAVDAILARRATNAFCLHRPPGHHAERAQAMGFCFFNHIAVAARHLLDQHGLERVAILDWDVHHGNGTQDSFYEDGRVFYFSVHQFPHYPFTGLDHETGAGAGAGTTLNVPLAAGRGDDDYLEVFRTRLRPALERFRPQFLLLSAGFDAHRADPLGDMAVTEDGFAQLTAQVTGLAAELCEGRLVSLLEGGYDLDATAVSVAAHLRGLCAAG